MIIEHDISGIGTVLTESRSKMYSLRPKETETDIFDTETYKLVYSVTPDAEYASPTDAAVPEDVTDIECNSVITLASPLETAWTTSDGTESGVAGTWQFTGWAADEALTAVITKTGKIWSDTTVYGSWTFVASPAPEPPEPEEPEADPSEADPSENA